VVEGVGVAAAAHVKENVAAPAALEVVSSSQGAEARPQEVSASLARLTPPAPILAAATEVD